MDLGTFILAKLENAILKLKRYRRYKIYSSLYKSYLKKQHFENKKAEGEDAYIQKWSVFGVPVEPYSYRFFRHYCGDTPNIVPEDIGRSYIEPILNPPDHRSTYSDKNLFPVIIGIDNVPRTIVCRINGGPLIDANYRYAIKELSEYIGESTALILKPSKATNSGHGIMKFEKRNDTFVSKEGNITLTKEFLLTYSRDFCLQKAVHQHPFMERLCPTSVNTIRLCLYRSVANNESIITAGIIRIGKKGAFVDNVHAGSMFAALDVASGELGKYVIDQYGNKEVIWNGIDFSKEKMMVPNWEKVIEFAKYVGTRIHHLRLIGLDITLDSSGKPILIEYNVCSFSYWLFMYTNQEPFGPYTDEVIKYCKKFY